MQKKKKSVRDFPQLGGSDLRLRQPEFTLQKHSVESEHAPLMLQSSPSGCELKTKVGRMTRQMAVSALNEPNIGHYTWLP